MMHELKDVPWLIGGAFNTLLTLDEHRGRSSPLQRSLQDLNDCIAACLLQHINYQGSPYTLSDCRVLG